MSSNNSSARNDFVTVFALLSAPVEEVLHQQQAPKAQTIIASASSLLEKLPDETILHGMSFTTSDENRACLDLLDAPGVVRISTNYQKALFGRLIAA